MDFYAEIVMDHFKHPRNAGELTDFDLVMEDLNPLCGDKVKIFLKVDKDGQIEKIGYTAQGCAISKAGMSLISEEVVGQRLEALKEIPAEKMNELIGTEVAPARVKCVQLGLSTLKKMATTVKIQSIIKNEENS